MSTSTVPFFKLSVGAAFIAFVLLLAGGAVYALRLRCEGFGCTGVGVLWLAWVAVYAPVLLTGTVLRSVLPHGAPFRSAVSVVLLVQVALGAGLACHWLLHYVA